MAEKIWRRNESKKCQLFRRQVQYLEWIAAADGYRLDTNNIRAVKYLVRQKRKTLGNARKLLGMIGYFKKYMPSFSKTAEPLYVLLKKTDSQRLIKIFDIMGVKHSKKRWVNFFYVS